MEEYIVERTLKRKIKKALILVFATILICIFYFFGEWLGFVDDMPTLLGIFYNIGRVLAPIIFPIMIWISILAIKDIWNNEPYLIIREDGLIQNMAKYQSGLIRWEDIENIKIIPILEETCIIRIFLRNPEKYISDPRMLERLKKRRARNINESELTITTSDFAEEARQVIDHIERFYQAKR